MTPPNYPKAEVPRYDGETAFALPVELRTDPKPVVAVVIMPDAGKHGHAKDDEGWPKAFAQ
jgi:3'-phosphoadenosine 5'-phosphosulfate (PAPS) 3'-phosphatase